MSSLDGGLSCPVCFTATTCTTGTAHFNKEEFIHLPQPHLGLRNTRDPAHLQHESVRQEPGQANVRSIDSRSRCIKIQWLHKLNGRAGEKAYRGDVSGAWVQPADRAVGGDGAGAGHALAGWAGHGAQGDVVPGPGAVGRGSDGDIGSGRAGGLGIDSRGPAWIVRMERM
jgi:hypothetical protein